MKKLVVSIAVFVSSLTYSQIDTLNRSEIAQLINDNVSAIEYEYIQPFANHAYLQSNFLNYLRDENFDVIENVINTKNFSLVYYDLNYKIEKLDTVNIGGHWIIYDDLYDTISKTYLNINFFKELSKHIPDNNKIKYQTFHHEDLVNIWYADENKFISKQNKNQIYEIVVNWDNNQITNIRVTVSNIK